MGRTTMTLPTMEQAQANMREGERQRLKARRFGLWSKSVGDEFTATEASLFVGPAAGARFNWTCGVYAIRRAETGETYVGCSASIRGRWSRHLTQLHHSRHPVPRMNELHRLLGGEGWRFRVLEFCDRDCLFAREKHWIDQLRPALNPPPRLRWTKPARAPGERV